MQRQQPLSRELARPQQIVEICAGVPAGAGRAAAAVEHRLVGFAPGRLGQVDAPTRGWIGDDRHPMSRQPGRHRAIERVDAALDAADQVIDFADPEQVPGPLGRQPFELACHP